MTIRRQPADFVVRERLGAGYRGSIVAKPDAANCYAILTLAKTSLATPDALRFLAQTVGVPAEQISYAGLKDKHAQTVQHVSIEPGPNRKPVRIAEHVAGASWEADLLGWADRPVTAEAIDGNSFELVVRDLSRAASDEMGRRADLLWCEARPEVGQPKGLLILNYFGDQRFGGARHHQGWAGRALIDGDFDAALRLAVGTPARKDAGRTRTFTRLCAAHWGDWKTLARDLPRCPERRPFERLAAGAELKQAFAALPNFTQQMAVEAYQSLLWNRAAALVAERLGEEGARHAAGDWGSNAGSQEHGGGRRQAGTGGHAPPGVLMTEDPFGDLLFPVPGRVGEEWRAMILPLLGRKTALDPAWGWAVQRVLADEGLTQDQLRIPGLHRPFYGEAPRRLFVMAERFEMSRGERDDMGAAGARGPGVRGMRRVCFDLPRGAYATVVLRALGQ